MLLLCVIKSAAAPKAEQAILALNRMLLDGKKIVVQEVAYKPGEFNN